MMFCLERGIIGKLALVPRRWVPRRENFAYGDGNHRFTGFSYRGRPGGQLLCRWASFAPGNDAFPRSGDTELIEPVLSIGGDGRRIKIGYCATQGNVDVLEGGTVVLAMGTVENTRMALNTVPEKLLIGRNLMAHLRSNLTFRVPHSSFAALNLAKELSVSALFVKGIHTRSTGAKGHFHVQITASGVGELGTNSEAELFKKIPNINELDQFQDLNDKWVVVTLRGIGEMIGDKTTADPQNRITLGAPDGNGVPRARIRLESDPKDASDPRGNLDNELWDAMDSACDELASILAGGGPIQYLSAPNDAGNAVWQTSPPSGNDRRDTLSSTHHEGGTLWMGDDPATSVTDSFGRIWELDNLYVVGPAVLPTLGLPKSDAFGRRPQSPDVGEDSVGTRPSVCRN
jgi:hypothetical protein